LHSHRRRNHHRPRWPHPRCPQEGQPRGELQPGRRFEGHLGAARLMLARVADSLYWMARYLERAEHTARLLAVKLDSMVDQSDEAAGAAWRRVVAALAGEHLVPDAFAITDALSFDAESSVSLLSSLHFARDNARQVRDHLSTEVWEHLNRLYLRLQDERTDR